MDAREALLRITILALDDSSFRSAWELAVRDGADAVCAQVVGAQLHGGGEGIIQYYRELPVVPGLEAAEVNSAYELAVKNVAQARLDKMTGKPGGLG